MIVVMLPGPWQAAQGLRWYFVCDDRECGLAGPLRHTRMAAVLDARAHAAAKAERQAALDAWPHDCIHEENVEHCIYGCAEDE